MATRIKIYLNPTKRPANSIDIHNPLPKDKRYATNQWKNYSKRFRGTNPTCGMCGRLYASHELNVDHIIPIHLMGAFWDKRNHQSLCRQCHTLKTRKEEGGQSMHEWILNDNKERIPAWSLSRS